MSVFILSIIIFIQVVFCIDFVSYGASQTWDIEKTRLGITDTYYSFDSATKTLTISGTGDTPHFKNDNVSQPWYLWADDGSIEHIVVEEGVTSIGNYFFYGVCAVDFSFPSTLVSIGRYAFNSSNSVREIILPDGLKTISDYAFYQAVGIAKVNIPSSVTSIGISAFENCYALSDLIFDDLYSELAIGKRAFFNCRNLKSVTLPKRASVGTYSFGFYYAQRIYYVYKDFVLNVYRDSPGYEYAVNTIKDNENYNIINELEMCEGMSVNCTYYADSFRDEMIFSFTPDISDYYSFYSLSDDKTVDVDCSFNENTYDDNSLDDLNFTVDSYLEAGNTYYFTVRCVSEISTGSFTVNLINKHSYSTDIVSPTLSADGYTTYSCVYCSSSFKSDYVKRLGILVTGKVLLMESPDKTHPHNLPVSGADITVDGSDIATTDDSGLFEFFIPSDAKNLTVTAQYSVGRSFNITAGENKEMKLGDISLFNFDYVRDGYVNAKDFAFVYSYYGKYSPDDYDNMRAIDINRDGVIDCEDFAYAQNFLTYGKITESIYN